MFLEGNQLHATEKEAVAKMVTQYRLFSVTNDAFLEKLDSSEPRTQKETFIISENV